MNAYCAEVAWMKCLDGLKLPLEVAFASIHDPDIVHIVEICLPMNLGMTLRDMAETKGYAGYKDRYANLLHRRPERKLPPTRIIKLDMEGWLPKLEMLYITCWVMILFCM
ncbi:hypothetical protein AVEN_97259-1 [Araneus ventricosus]|uniref:Uncharacterized protein n=1 Tax=Araneus ventricosus TaxID=182803 RepID=A0A4Y1ZMY9_ARAVE|nr:hypothetical protein AVEN_97259-1 [Araneus ventricosus]